MTKPRKDSSPLEMYEKPIGTTWEERDGALTESTELAPAFSMAASMIDSLAAASLASYNVKTIAEYGMQGLRSQAERTVLRRAMLIGVHQGPIFRDQDDFEVYTEERDIGLGPRVEELENNFESFDARLENIETQQADVSGVVHAIRTLKADFESLRADVVGDAGSNRRLMISQIEVVTRQIASVSKVYDVPDQGNLVRHFAERPKLAQLLLDSADEITKRFEHGPASIVDDDGELVMRIPTQLSPAVGHMRFSAFLRDWWIPKAGIEDKMTLTIDYV